MRKNRTLLLLVVLSFTGLLGIAMSASAQGRNQNPAVFPPFSHAYGQSFNQWSVEWVQWVMSIPNANNPLNDDTGALCGEGQEGQVWFLAGSWVGPVERECAIPAGKALFFPIANFWWIVTPGDDGFGILIGRKTGSSITKRS